MRRALVLVVTFFLLRDLCAGLNPTFSHRFRGVGVTPDGQMAIIFDAGNYILRKVSLHQCENCPSGTYNNGTGAGSRATCSKCPNNTYLASPGATSEAMCLPCAGNATAPAGSVSCQCKAGFSGPLWGPPCAICPRGSYSPQGSSACLLCPAAATSPPGSKTLASCDCGAGAYLEYGGGLSTIAGTTTAGFENGESGDARFNSPHGLTVSKNGTVLIADRGNGKIRMLDLETGAVSSLVTTGYSLVFPNHLVELPDGSLAISVGYHTWNHRILRMDRSSGETSTFAGGPHGSQLPCLACEIIASISTKKGLPRFYVS